EFSWWVGDFIDELYRIQPQIINHDGHGYPNYMLKAGSDAFYSFENEKPFFIYSHSCLTGSFDNYYPGDQYREEDCIAEILTCEIPFGAFACILNARYGLGSEHSPISPSGSFDESFYKALFTNNIRELGRANHFSKEDNVWRINDNGYRWCYYQTNLFGDPQLRIKSPYEIPPEKPTMPSGPTSGKVGVECMYSTSTTDPNDYDVYYLFDWGDGSFSSWLGPYPSGEICESRYTWDTSGDYLIKVKAKNINEVESVWSDPLPISMPKVHTYNPITQLILKMLERHPFLQSLFFF
ncbi:MAG: C25 family cysteine peptidase, partial [Thermoplasmatota archaeon]